MQAIDTSLLNWIRPDSKVLAAVVSLVEMYGLTSSVQISFEPAQSVPKRTSAPLPNNKYFMVLKISSNLHRQPKVKFDISSDREPILCREMVKGVAYSVVPKPEALKCLAILQERNPKLTLRDFLMIHPSNSAQTRYHECLVDHTNDPGQRKILDTYVVEQKIYTTEITLLGCDIVGNFHVIAEVLGHLSDNIVPLLVPAN